MLTIFLVFLFISGLMIGSFLNVVIYRLESKQKNVITEKRKNKRKDLFGRSFCPNCGNQIAWHDNIPIISWLVLRGKCRDCKKRISVQYPLVELATGLVFASFVVIPAEAGIQSVTGIINLVFWLFFASCLISIFVYDLKHQIIPDEVIYTALIAGLLYAAINFALLGDYKYLLDHFFSGLLAGGFFFFLAAVSKGKWMGGGDIKLAAFMGLVLGWQGVLVALYIAFILGAIVGSIALLTKEKKLGSKIPFGPFLVIGTLISFLFAEKVIYIYGKIFL